MKKILTIQGITCEKCAEKLSEVLYSAPEVEEVTVDIDNKEVELELNYELSGETLKMLVKSAGKYEITEIK